MPSVEVGEAVYTVLSSGATPAQVAKDGLKEAEATVFTPNTLSPKRLQARYLFRVEDSQLMAIEDALRLDLRGALADQMDLQVLQGDGTIPIARQPKVKSASQRLRFGISRFCDLLLFRNCGIKRPKTGGSMSELISGPAGANKSAIARQVLAENPGSIVADFQSIFVALTLAQRGADGRFPLRDERLLPLVEYLRRAIITQARIRGWNIIATNSDGDPLRRHFLLDQLGPVHG